MLVASGSARRLAASPQGASPVASGPVAQFIHPPAFERRCIRPSFVALLSPYLPVRLSRAPCWRGASTLSVLRRSDELNHSLPVSALQMSPASCPPFVLQRGYPRERISYGSGVRLPVRAPVLRHPRHKGRCVPCPQPTGQQVQGRGVPRYRHFFLDSIGIDAVCIQST